MRRRALSETLADAEPAATARAARAARLGAPLSTSSVLSLQASIGNASTARLLADRATPRPLETAVQLLGERVLVRTARGVVRAAGGAARAGLGPAARPAAGRAAGGRRLRLQLPAPAPASSPWPSALLRPGGPTPLALRPLVPGPSAGGFGAGRTARGAGGRAVDADEAGTREEAETREEEAETREEDAGTRDAGTETAGGTGGGAGAGAGSGAEARTGTSPWATMAKRYLVGGAFVLGGGAFIAREAGDETGRQFQAWKAVELAERRAAAEARRPVREAELKELFTSKAKRELGIEPADPAKDAAEDARIAALGAELFKERIDTSAWGMTQDAEFARGSRGILNSYGALADKIENPVVALGLLTCGVVDVQQMLSRGKVVAAEIDARGSDSEGYQRHLRASLDAQIRAEVATTLEAARREASEQVRALPRKAVAKAGQSTLKAIAGLPRSVILAIRAGRAAADLPGTAAKAADHAAEAAQHAARVAALVAEHADAIGFADTVATAAKEQALTAGQRAAAGMAWGKGLHAMISASAGPLAGAAFAGAGLVGGAYRAGSGLASGPAHPWGAAGTGGAETMLAEADRQALAAIRPVGCPLEQGFLPSHRA